MPKATITLPDGTLVTIDGNPEEISRILRLYSAREGKPATRQPVGEAPLETISARVQEGAAAKDRPRRRVPIVWWLVPILLAVLVLGWIVLYGKLNSVSKTLDQAVTMQAATETARFGLEPSLPRSTPTSLAGCSATKSCTYRDMTLCFLQYGAESDWRTANTASVKKTALRLGATLIFSDPQESQQNQISALRACIQQKVDVIALAPVVEDGWDAVLKEGKNAGIPVVLVDRTVSADPSL